MSLPWVRLDTGFPQNPKILHLAQDGKWRAIACYVGGLSYAGAQGTDGFLPMSCLPFIHGTTKVAADLVEVGLWKACPGGWDVNGWVEFQPTSEENIARRQRSKAAAEIRWSKARASKAK